jgi:acetyltransferase-like isoleucine patch superfamily enzyme
MSMLKRIALATYPRPLGIGSLGTQSLVMLPRRIQGARRIHLGANVIVQSGAWLAAIESFGAQRFDPRIVIEDGARIGKGAIITAIESVRVGEGTLFSEQVFVSDHTHQAVPGVVPPTKQPLVPRGHVSIGRHCFVGIRACIFGGVNLGDYCVVGANSVVTRSFPAGSVIAGAPARLVKSLELPPNV